MRLMNRKTGAIVEAPFTFGGGDWVSAEDYEKESEQMATGLEVMPQERSPKSQPTADTELSKADIMRELDAFGVDYNPRAKKADLYKLMQEQLNNG